MGKREFTKEQIEDLLTNKNVIRCTEKAITYSNDFKINAIREYHENGKGMRQIFKEAGFDLNVIGYQTPKNCLVDWNKIYRTRGIEKLSSDHRGKRSTGRPRSKGLTDTEKIERLETEVAYLRAENDFLIKLRSGKTE